MADGVWSSAAPLYVQVLVNAAEKGDGGDTEGARPRDGDDDAMAISVSFVLLDPYNHLQATAYTKALLEV